MSVTFHVWNAVISLSMAELKSTMCDGDRGNRGVGNQEWSGVEQNGAERSRTEQNGVEQSGTEWNKNNKNKNKGKMRYHHTSGVKMELWFDGRD